MDVLESTEGNTTKEVRQRKWDATTIPLFRECNIADDQYMCEQPCNTCSTKDWISLHVQRIAWIFESSSKILSTSINIYLRRKIFTSIYIPLYLLSFFVILWLYFCLYSVTEYFIKVPTFAVFLKITPIKFRSDTFWSL